MEWKFAKRVVIILLIVLNAILAGLNYKNNQKNVLTVTQEKAIFEVLSRYGISLYTDLLTDFPPMRKVALQVPSYGQADWKRMFFEDEETSVTVEFDQTILKTKEKVLTIKGNHGTLEFLNVAKEKGEMTAAQAVKKAGFFMDKAKKGHFQFGGMQEEENGYWITYFEEYKGKPIFASQYDIFVSQGGVKWVKMDLFELEGFSGDKKDICFSDEALLTFLREVRKDESDQDPITVTKMELGYDFQDDEEAVAGSIMKLVPCYRISVMGESEDYMINAYTNELIEKKSVEKMD